MRTAVIILTGLGIWAIGLFLAYRRGKPGGTAVADATLAFITFWLLAAATSVWIGMTQAGYTLREELPVFCLVFGIPAAVAAIVKWKFF